MTHESTCNCSRKLVPAAGGPHSRPPRPRPLAEVLTEGRTPAGRCGGRRSGPGLHGLPAHDRPAARSRSGLSSRAARSSQDPSGVLHRSGRMGSQFSCRAAAGGSEHPDIPRTGLMSAASGPIWSTKLRRVWLSSCVVATMGSTSFTSCLLMSGLRWRDPMTSFFNQTVQGCRTAL